MHWWRITDVKNIKGKEGKFTGAGAQDPSYLSWDYKDVLTGDTGDPQICSKG